MKHYDAWLAKCEEVGWPKHYRDDLLIYDRDICAKIPDDAVLFFAMRECGTHTHYVCDEFNLNWIDAIAGGPSRGGAPTRFFIWENFKLREVDAARWKESAHSVRMFKYRIELRQQERFSPVVFHDKTVRAISADAARVIGEWELKKLKDCGCNAELRGVVELKS
jgi:hypothetical protein